MEAPGSRFVPGRRGALAQFKVNSLTGPWRIAIRATDGTSVSQFRSMAVLEQASWKWQELAERRRAHLVELFHSGRWKRYFTEQQFLHRLRDAIQASERWSEIASALNSAQAPQSDTHGRHRAAARPRRPSNAAIGIGRVREGSPRSCTVLSRTRLPGLVISSYAARSTIAIIATCSVSPNPTRHDQCPFFPNPARCSRPSQPDRRFSHVPVQRR